MPSGRGAAKGSHGGAGRLAGQAVTPGPLRARQVLELNRRAQITEGIAGKPGAVISVSPGAIGGFGANHHLRQMLVFLNVPTMQQPEAYVGHAANLFDEKGALTNDSTREFLKNFVDSFARWIDAILVGR